MKAGNGNWREAFRAARNQNVTEWGEFETALEQAESLQRSDAEWTEARRTEYAEALDRCAELEDELTGGTAIVSALDDDAVADRLQVQSLRSEALRTGVFRDVFSFLQPSGIACRVCGDSEGGPWVRRGGQWFCECCADKVEVAQ